MELHVNIDRQLKISTNSSPLVNPGSNNSNYKNNNQFQQKIMLRLLKLRHVRTSKGNLQGHGYIYFKLHPLKISQYYSEHYSHCI